MTDRQALLSAAGKQRPYKAVNIKPPAMPGDIYFCDLAIFLFLGVDNRGERLYNYILSAGSNTAGMISRDGAVGSSSGS